MPEKFQKKKLNRDDHKKMEDTAKNIKRGGGALLAAGLAFAAIKKNGPKLISAAKNIITKA